VYSEYMYIYIYTYIYKHTYSATVRAIRMFIYICVNHRSLWQKSPLKETIFCIIDLQRNCSTVQVRAVRVRPLSERGRDRNRVSAREVQRERRDRQKHCNMHCKTPHSEHT